MATARRDSPAFQQLYSSFHSFSVSGGQNQQCPHGWADWLHNPCHLGGPRRFRAGNKSSGGPQMGRLAAQPLPMLQSGGQNQQQPTSGQISYITLATWGVNNTSKRGTKSTVAYKWADWLHNSPRLEGPQRFRVEESSFVFGVNCVFSFGVGRIKKKVKCKKRKWKIFS